MQVARCSTACVHVCMHSHHSCMCMAQPPSVCAVEGSTAATDDNIVHADVHDGRRTLRAGPTLRATPRRTLPAAPKPPLKRTASGVSITYQWKSPKST